MSGKCFSFADFNAKQLYATFPNCLPICWNCRDGLARGRCLFWMNIALETGWEDATDICVILVTFWRGQMLGTWSTRRFCTTASRFVPPMFTAIGTGLHTDAPHYLDVRCWERYGSWKQERGWRTKGSLQVIIIFLHFCFSVYYIFPCDCSL